MKNKPESNATADFVQAVYSKEGRTIKELCVALVWPESFNKRFIRLVKDSQGLVTTIKEGGYNRYYRTRKGKGWSANEAKQYVLGRKPGRQS